VQIVELEILENCKAEKIGWKEKGASVAWAPTAAQIPRQQHRRMVCLVREKLA
jgi:hypothetical protein